jgi:hypothetical protein
MKPDGLTQDDFISLMRFAVFFGDSAIAWRVRFPSTFWQVRSLADAPHISNRGLADGM